MEKADWNRADFSWRLTVDNLSIQRICSDRGFQVDGAEKEKARDEKLR